MSGQQQIPYLEERKLIKRWSGPWPMLANMAFTLLIFAVTWWVFQDRAGSCVSTRRMSATTIAAGG